MSSKPLLRFQPSALALAALLATCAQAGAHAQPGASAPAASAPAQRSFAIDAGPLDEALLRLSAAAGLGLSFEPALVEGLRSPGLRGSYGNEEALRRVLAGSGLEAQPRGDGLYVLRKAAVVREGSAASMAAVTVSARAERTATTEGSDSLAVRAVSINKGNQALKDIPQSISVVTRKQLDEQAITDLRVAANSITGMVGAQGVGQGMVLFARGFEINDWQYDGVAIPRNNYALGNWGTEGMVFYDRMEVLRGASGLLQGTGSPGGAVNLVRKRGQSEKTVTVTARAGSWDRYGLQLDAGGPLNDEGTLRGRLVVDESQGHSFIDYVNDRSTSLYAALDYDIGPDTTVGVGVSHSDSQSRPMIYGVPLRADGSDVGLPRSTYTGAWWNQGSIEQTMLYADLDHRFNADWKLRIAAVRLSEKNTSTHQRMHGDVAADGSGMTYANWITDFDSEKVGLDAFVNGKFEALGLRHETTFGASYSKYTSDDMFARTFTAGGNLFAIDHNRPRPTAQSMLADGGRQFRAAYDVQQKGIYASLRSRLTEPLTAILGARASWYDSIYDDRTAGTRSETTATREITPYAGLVYALTPQWSAYGSYTGVFVPQSERTAAGAVLDPIIGKNYELGLKGELADGRVNASLAVFRYDHSQRAVNDLDAGFACDGWYCSRNSGKVRSQGFEAEVSGEVLRNLQVMAGYTYNTTEFLSDPEEQGKVFSTITPKHMLRTWVAYRLPGEWNQFTVGGGVNTQSHTLGYDRSFKLAGFTVANLRMSWQATRELNLAVNVNNVFDKRYVLPGYVGYTGASYGEPRNVMVTLKYTPGL
ncbi:TonB-dependent siderophore receptor [Comamonas antarctica]|uniref:TonB-dependent siderophore receptor n=1 Tax=Comamonas antarctica TaxID=2743470 RepID=UPI0028EC015E|nr:TonB-dependent siderophore receptor [Comamonas antarctica]